MPKHLILFFMVALLVESCGPAPTPPLTATVTPTMTPSPSPSATPTPVPQTGEHLIVTRDHKHWAVLNADGSLQKYIQATDISDPSDVSPDGNWLVYESGSFEEEPYDFALSLLNMDDGTLQFVTTVISPDFPENIEPIVKTISQYDPSLYGEDCADIKCRRSLVQEEVEISAGISQWSPDGQWLAFAAQIDGPSTDIYIYSMQNKTIRRLTDDVQNIDSMEWSPDGKRILYANNIPGNVYERRAFYVTNLEGRSLSLSQEKLTNDSEWYMHGWISNDLYLLQAFHSEPGQEHFCQLVVLNAENGQITEIWPYPTDKVVIDTINQRIVLSFIQYPFNDPIPEAPEDGTYFVSTNGDRQKISDQVFYSIVDSPQIIGTTEAGIAYHVLRDGAIKRIGPSELGWINSSSPDEEWFFLVEAYYEGHSTFSLYDNAYQQIKSWALEENLRKITWRPDSLGIFLFTDDNIYYLAIPDGQLQLLNVEVPPCPWKDYDSLVCKWPEFAWRP